MPTNKNAQLRYQILDRCLSNRHRRYTIDDLLETVNDALYDMYGSKGQIQMRQIRDDIKFMRDSESYRAPIEAIPFDGKKCYYRYADPHFSIFNNELSVEEVSRLRSTIEMLGRFRGIPGNGWLEEVISNLEYRFGVKANNENAVSFEQNEQLKGLEYLSTIIDATVNHQPLRLLYRSYKGHEDTVTIHPYHVKEFNNRWFLFGLEESKYGGRIVMQDKTLQSICTNDSTFEQDFTVYLKAFDDGLKQLLDIERDRTDQKFLNMDGTVAELRKKNAVHKISIEPYTISDYEIIPHHLSDVINAREIIAFMDRYVSKPYKLGNNTVGVEINFNKEFYVPEKLASVEDILKEIEELDKELGGIEI